MNAVRRWGWLGLLLLFGGLLGGFSVPLPRFAEDLQVNGPQEGDVQALDVHIDYPMLLRAGDADTFRLKVKLIGRSPMEGKAASISTTLGFAGIIGEQAEIHELMLPGGQGNFSWPIIGNPVEPAEGTLWLAINPDGAVKSNEADDVLLAKPLEIQTFDSGGIPAWIWRIVGLFGLLVGLIWGAWEWVRWKKTKKVEGAVP